MQKNRKIFFKLEELNTTSRKGKIGKHENSKVAVKALNKDYSVLEGYLLKMIYVLMLH